MYRAIPTIDYKDLIWEIQKRTLFGYRYVATADDKEEVLRMLKHLKQEAIR